MSQSAAIRACFAKRQMTSGASAYQYHPSFPPSGSAMSGGARLADECGGIHGLRERERGERECGCREVRRFSDPGRRAISGDT